MKRETFLVSILFAIASGIYWYCIGQVLPIAAPMMLGDNEMLGRVFVETLLVLAIYVALATLFFRWLLSRPRL